MWSTGQPLSSPWEPMEVGVRPQGHELGLRKPEMEMRGGSRRPGGHEGGGDRQVGTPECPIGNLQSPPLTLLGASSVRHKVLETGGGKEVARLRGDQKMGGDNGTLRWRERGEEATACFQSPPRKNSHVRLFSRWTKGTRCSANRFLGRKTKPKPYRPRRYKKEA